MSSKLVPLLVTMALASSTLSCKRLVEKFAKKSGSEGAVAPSAEPKPAVASKKDVAPLENFEGTLVVRVASQKQKVPLPDFRVQVGGKRVRIEVPDGEHLPPGVSGVYALFAPEEKRGSIVVGSLKQRLSLDFETLQSQLGGLAPVRTPPSAPKEAPLAKRTGEKATVAGLSCEEWELTAKEGGTSKVCVAEAEVGWMGLDAHSPAPGGEWPKDLLDGRHVPVRFVSFAEKGAEEFRVELVEVKREKLSPKVFAEPSNFRTLEFADFMSGVMVGLARSGLGPATPSSSDPMVASPPTLPPDLKKRLEEARAKATQPRNSQSR